MLTRSCMVLLALCLLASGARADWPQLQADAKRSGYSPDAIRPPFKLKWAWYGDSTQYAGQPKPDHASVKIGNLVQPIVVQGKVFVGGMDGALYCIDAEKGTTRWSYKTGRPIIHTAAFIDGMVIVNSMDGAVHAVRADDGQPAWNFPTPYGIMSAPVVADGTVYVTCRDGRALAINAADGKLKWACEVGAPIVHTPAISNGVLVFGSEDMFMHGIDVVNGRELWRTRVSGQSFRSTWPVIYNDMVILGTIPSISGSESGLLWDPKIEEILADCPPNNWPAEREALLKYLTENPQRQTVFVLDLKTGTTRYIPPIGYVGGNMEPPMPAVYDPQGRIYIYWRTRSSRIQKAGTYGTNFRPDISWMDPATGDRIVLPYGDIHQYFACELDNNFMLTLGGDVLYGANHFRCNLLMDTDGEFYGISKPFKDERDGGYPVPPGTYSHFPVRGDQPLAPMTGTNGESAVVPVGNTIYINETGANCVCAFVGTTGGGK